MLLLKKCCGLELAGVQNLQDPGHSSGTRQTIQMGKAALPATGLAFEIKVLNEVVLQQEWQGLLFLWRPVQQLALCHAHLPPPAHPGHMLCAQTCCDHEAISAGVSHEQMCAAQCRDGGKQPGTFMCADCCSSKKGEGLTMQGTSMRSWLIHQEWIHAAGKGNQLAVTMTVSQLQICEELTASKPGLELFLHQHTQDIIPAPPDSSERLHSAVTGCLQQCPTITTPGGKSG